MSDLDEDLPRWRPRTPPTPSQEYLANVTDFVSPTPVRILNHKTEKPIPLPDGKVLMSTFVADFLRTTVLPICPDMYHKNAARHTGDPFRSKANRDDADADECEEVVENGKKSFPRLSKFVYHSSLVDPLVKPATSLLGELSIDYNDGNDYAWLCKVHPDWTAVDLPKKINSEKDSEKYVTEVKVHPVVRCLGAVSAPVKSLQRIYSQSTFDSGSGRGSAYPIPDILVFREGIIIATIEVKTHNALKSTLGKKAGTFECLLGVPSLTMSYHYPQEGKDGSPSSLAKMIIQVWEQMWDAQVDFAVLTSYKQMMFFYKKPGSKDTLYMSHPFMRNDSPLLILFAFLACASGLLDPNHIIRALPELDTKWWSDDVHQNLGDHVGIHPKSMPDVYLRLQKAAAAPPPSSLVQPTTSRPQTRSHRHRPAHPTAI